MMYKLCYVFALVTFLSCDKPADQTAVNPAKSKSLSFKENVALFDVRVRAVDAENFVRELVLADFSGEKILGDAVAFNDLAYTDDGKLFDTRAGDGIFTSVEKSAYNESIKIGSLTGSQTKSLLDAPIVNADFKKYTELSIYRQNVPRYVASVPNARVLLPPIYICDVTYGGDHCRAHQNGWCTNCCIELSNCRWIVLPI